MRLLLDTNVLLLADRAPKRLGQLRDAILSEDVLVSPIATWEIAIKASTGMLPLTITPDAYVEQARQAMHARWLSIMSRHLSAVSDLPWHHRDPFDRALIATAMVEGLTLATTDKTLARYDVDVLLP